MNDDEERFPGFGGVIAAMICGVLVVAIAAGLAIAFT